MIKRTKHMLFLVMLMLLFSSQVGATSNELSLEQVVELVLQESIDYRIAVVEWDQAQLAHRKALADNLLTQSAYNERVAELNLMKGEVAYKKSLAGAIIAAVRRFTDLELARTDLHIKKLKLDQTAKAEELTLRKAAAQNASELDVLEARANLAKGRFDYQTAQDSLAEKQQAFNMAVGSGEFTPDGKLTFVDFHLQLAEILTRVLESSPSIQEAKDNVEIATMDLERLLLDQTAELVVKEARNKLALARLRLEQSQGAITQEILAAYNSVTNAHRSLDASNNAHGLQIRQYQVTEGQVAAGLKTEDDLLTAKIALQESERSVYQALSSYILALLQLDETSGEDVQLRLEAMMPADNS